MYYNKFLIYSPKKWHKMKLFCIHFKTCFDNLTTSTLLLLCNMNFYFHITFFFNWRCGPTRTMSSFMRFLYHTQRHKTIGRTPLHEFYSRCSVHRKSWLKKSNRCNSMQIFIYCKFTLHVSGVTAPIIRGT